jgi:excinuclease ABC subunit C
MRDRAAGKNFEQAAKLRDTLLAVENLYRGRPAPHELLSLKEALGLAQLPLVIEAIDISNLGEADSVGSVVVFKDGNPDKDNYRRFLIKSVKALDDYAKMAEVVRRRYRRLLEEKRRLPDLLVIDGGKGHVSCVYREMRTLGLSLPVIGIAKRNEDIWFPYRDKPLRLSGDSPCLHLLQRIRDEAHRFAHTYQLTRRRMKLKKRPDYD